MTLEEARKEGANRVPVAEPVRRDPAQQEWWDVNSSINLASFGFADNFDSTYSFKLPFYVDRNVRKILEVGLTLVFQKFRGYVKPLAHTHSVTIGDHTHTVTIGDHTHTVTIGDHSHSVPGVSHSHGLSNVTVFSFVSNVPGSYTQREYSFTGTAGSRRAAINTNAAEDIKLVGGATSDSTTPSSTTSGSGGGTSVSSSSGGGTSVSSSSGGATTPTSGSGSGAEYGIFEDTYPANVSVYLDGIDITTNLGGAMNPDAVTNVFKDFDLTPFVDGGGLHVLELTTSARGRVVPLLWVKSIISR